MSSSEAVARVFDQVADTYDGVGVPWFQPIAAGLVDELAVRPGERVLDVGCGRGAALKPLAEAAGRTGRVLGVDLAPRMVERTAHDLRHLPQVEVRVADAEHLDLPPSSFDVIASSLVLFFLLDPTAALRSWAGLLAPGGRVGVSTFGPQDDRWRQIDALFAPYLPPGMLDARTSGHRGPFSSDEGVAQLFDDAGLAEITTAHRRIEAVFRNAEHFVEFSWSHGQRGMWEAVPAADRATLQSQITDAARSHADDTGVIRFTQHVRYTQGRRS